MLSAITPEWIIPIHPRGKVLKGHSLILDQGRIHDLIEASELRSRYPEIDELSLPGHVLLPGFVNLHTHAGMSLLRGFADDLPLMTWLQDKIWPAEAKHLSPEFVRIGSLLACTEFIQSGITTFNDMYFFPGVTAQAVIDSGLRAALGMTVLEFPTAYANDADDYLHRGLKIRDEFRHEPRLSFTLAPHAPYTVSDTTFRKVLTYAEQLDLQIHLHVNETRQEITDSATHHRTSPVLRLLDLGILGPRLIAVHAVHLNDEELRLFSERGVSIAHCPHSNLKLGSGIAPIQKALELGINVGIGTDSSASNNQLNLLQEMRTAALIAKGFSEDASALPASQALEMATLGGARALGLGDQVGTLEVGKQADMIAIKLDRPDTSPVFDPISQVVYSASRDAIQYVWVAGQKILADGNLTQVDVLGLQEELRHWQVRLQEN